MDPNREKLFGSRGGKPQGTPNRLPSLPPHPSGSPSPYQAPMQPSSRQPAASGYPPSNGYPPTNRYPSSPRQPQDYGNEYGNDPRASQDPRSLSAANVNRASTPSYRTFIQTTPSEKFVSLLASSNFAAVSPRDFPRAPRLAQNTTSIDPFEGHNKDFLVHVKSQPDDAGAVFSAIAIDELREGQMYLPLYQRRSAGIFDVENPIRIIAAPYTSQAPLLSNIEIEIDIAKPVSSNTVDLNELHGIFMKSFIGQILGPGHQLLVPYERSGRLRLLVRAVQCSGGPMVSIADTQGPPVFGEVDLPLQFNWTANSIAGVRLVGRGGPAAPMIDLMSAKTFEDMGIGGLASQLKEVQDRVFNPRQADPDLVKRLGVKPCKGLLLYGPPGTGKTLIARKIGEHLKAKPPKVVNGPEVLSKFVGESEENIRNLFADAEKDYKKNGAKAELHVIIFDELDAVCKQRGMSSSAGSGVGDTIVNQLLTKLDGVDQLPNVLLIGMTNRRDLIDAALLRPGRLEVQVEIPLPSKQGRRQILDIMTKEMRANNLMGPDVDLDDIAERTNNYSGAELEGVMNAVRTNVLERQKSAKDGGEEPDPTDIMARQSDFYSALGKIKTANGSESSSLRDACSHGIIPFNFSHSQIQERCLSSAQKVKDDSFQLQTILLYGSEGAGTSAFGANLALEADFGYVRRLTPMDLAKAPGEADKYQKLYDEFQLAYSRSHALIILDNIELMLDWQTLGPVYSTKVMQGLNLLIRSKPPRGCSLLVIATTNNPEMVRRLRLKSMFSFAFQLPLVEDSRQLQLVLQSDPRTDDPPVTTSLVNAVRQVNGSADVVNVGVKDVLEYITAAMLPDGFDENIFAMSLAEKRQENVLDSF